jgi:pimeloyl-ACP methyl ester carboxylesterase/quinol monooxygenase YgiN
VAAADPPPTPAANEQVMLVVRLDTRPGVDAQMSEALAQLADPTRQHDRGVIRFEIGLDPADGSRVVGYEIWESQQALAEHSAKEHTQRFLTRARDLVVDPAEPLRAERWRPFYPETPAEYAAPHETLRAPAAVPAAFRSEHRQIGDAQLHYVIGGSGPLVVLLHGFPNTWYAWRDVMTELAQTMTVLALDLRGLGDSEPGTQPNDVPTGAHDLAVLLEELDLGAAFVAGQDWGGSTAFAFATAYPESVKALAVIEAMPAGPWTDPNASSPWFVGFHQIPDLPEQLVRGRERLYLGWLYQAFSATPNVPDTATVDEYLRTYTRPGAMASAFERYRTIDSQIAHNTRYATEPITTPTLAVGGERVFGAAVAENLRHAASNLETAVINDCGHYVSEERPHELARLLLTFFGKHA